MVPVLYLLFFLSGAAALVYEVAWVRSLSLVFGGSHLAVTTVLAVFMGGLALGSRIFGRRADASPRPLRLYGALEIGIGLFAVAFLGLARVYPTVYVPLARVAEENRLWLSAVRVLLAVAAMIVPTTLMGGTLPVLTRFVARHAGSLGGRLSFLYGLNTLGAAVGALAAGFVLLKTLGVTATVLVAVAANVVVGLVALALPERAFGQESDSPPGEQPREAGPWDGEQVDAASLRLVLWGVGASGFCALGYEVLWTRVLSLVVGTSVYSFTIILVAFLAGIAIGSAALGLAQKRQPWSAGRAIAAFAAVQIAIGISALVVTVLMRDLPSHAMRLQRLLAGAHGGEFGVRQGASFGVAFAYVLVPAFLMGVAFPLAGTIQAASRKSVGGAVGAVLTYNTVGAILGSAVSGFALIYVFGIERSLQMLAVVNGVVGIAVAVSLSRRRVLVAAVSVAGAGLLAALAAFPGWGRAWDLRYFAIFRNNQRGVFDTPAQRKDAIENTDILYYFEGVNETISVVRPKGSMQAFIVNGRPEATTSPMDMQCQRTLGHLPMLLHSDPRRVFVLGTGTGMTLGATAIHPGVERIVLAEIEPGALGAARTFGEYNHRVLDDPRVHVVLNDGRNYLATTRERFDVVTADPIHPWSGGAAYLYTREYFRSVAEHLLPGGIATQWLPIYELSVKDVQTVVGTFAGSFRYVMIWLTHYDAELVGSNSPIVIDEAALSRRISQPAIAQDLAVVQMGSAEDFLSYFVTGDEGVRGFARGGVVNTDDNLFLEFSAPESMGVGSIMDDIVEKLARSRESIVPYLMPASGEEERAEQRARWERNLEAARLYDAAHAMLLRGERGTARFLQVGAALERRFPGYAPFRFLRREIQVAEAGTPRLADTVRFRVATPGGSRLLQVSAVTMRIGDARAVLVLVDHDRRDVYGQRYFDGRADELDAAVRKFTVDALGALRETYEQVAAEARGRGEPLPAEAFLVRRLKERVASMVAEGPR